MWSTRGAQHATPRAHGNLQRAVLLLLLSSPLLFIASLNKVIIIIKSLWMLSISPCKYPGAFFFSRRSIPVDVHMTDFYSRLQEKLRNGDVYNPRHADKLNGPQQDFVQFWDQEYFRVRERARHLTRTQRYSDFIRQQNAEGHLVQFQTTPFKSPMFLFLKNVFIQLLKPRLFYSGLYRKSDCFGHFSCVSAHYAYGSGPSQS